MKYINWMNNLPWQVRLFLAFPLLDGIFFSLYRMCKGDVPNIVLGILWIPIGALVGWLIDMVQIASGKEVVTF